MKKSAKITALLLVIVMLLSTAVGCASSGKQTATTAPDTAKTDTAKTEAKTEPATEQKQEEPATKAEVEAKEGEAVDESKDTLVFAADRETATLDPQAFAVGEWAQREIYESLLEINVDGEIEPRLAKEWEKVDDLTWKFVLRDDVYFHNGEHMTSADVLYTFKRSQEDVQVASVINFLDLDNCRADGDYVVYIATKEPYALFERMMAHLYLSILNEKAVTDAGTKEEFARNPVGTGPYKFVSWTAGNNITLVRNDQYWGEKAKVKNLVIRFITEMTSRAIALEAGDVDICDDVSAEDLSRIAEGDDTAILQYTNAGARYIAINCQHKYLDNATVRQALRYATDIDTINELIYPGVYLTPQSSMVPPSVPGHDFDLPEHEYNVEKAKQLLAEAGYADGFELEFVYNGNSSQNNTFVQLLQEQWAEIGVKVIISPTDSAKLNTALNEGTYDLSLCNSVVNPCEAGYMVGFWYATDKCGSGNRSWISDAEMDAIIAELEKTSDSAARQELAKKAQERSYELANIITVHHVLKAYGLRKNVRGLAGSCNAYPDLSKVYFAK